METRAYNESYLPAAMSNLAAMMDCGVNKYGMSPSLFYRRFLVSGLAEQFGNGNPRFIAGFSGAELADYAIERTGGEISERNDGSFSLSPEYWAGWVLAYYQWKTDRTFSFLERNGLDIDKVISLYHPLHEADLEKFADSADAIVAKSLKSAPSPLKKARFVLGISQRELADKSGITLRMIREYEQKPEYLSKAGYSTVARLASVLKVKEEDLL